MKPRIFVSSTFYDLKYIREDLANFIKAHDFEPTMFEEGDIGYTPGKALDLSCYENMKTADMVILIIGGQYGSIASDENTEDIDEYISVTRREFRTAVESGIPIFAFVDSKVYTEYDIYEANIEAIGNGCDIKFRAVKDINVFRFIKEIRNIGNISITEFDKIIDIKDFLSKQWSDMFKNYLTDLRVKTNEKRLEDAVENINNLIRKMDIMLDTVGKKILDNDGEGEYETVISKQRILSFCDNITRNLTLEKEEYLQDQNDRKQYLDNFLNVLHNSIKIDVWDKFRNDDFGIASQFFEYFIGHGVHLHSSSIQFDDTVKKNDDILVNSDLKKILVDELQQENNYKDLFNDITF